MNIKSIVAIYHRRGLDIRHMPWYDVVQQVEGELYDDDKAKTSKANVILL